MIDIDDEKYVIFTIKDTRCAIPIGSVKEFIAIPSEVAQMPDAPPQVRGVINIRGKIIPLYDTRKMMDLPSLKEDHEVILDNIRAAEGKHKSWMSQLEASVCDKKEFSGERNPHKCDFGRWLDKYISSTSKENRLYGHLNSISDCHKGIHGTADKVTDLMDRQDNEGAAKLVYHTKEYDMPNLLKHIEGTYEIVKENAQREIALILEDTKGYVSFSVDQVKAIDKIVDLEEFRLSKAESMIRCHGKDSHGNPTFIMDYKRAIYK